MVHGWKTEGRKRVLVLVEGCWERKGGLAE